MSDKNKTADYDVSADDEFVIEDEIEDDELATVLDESLSSDDLALPEMTEQLTEPNCLPSQKSDFVQEKSTCMLNGHYDSETAHSPLNRESQAEQIGLHEELCEFDELVVEDAIEEDRESNIREDFAKAEHTFDTAENPEQATAEYSPDKENALHEIVESSSEVELSDRVLESGSGEPEVLPITNPTAQTLDHVQTKSYSEANVTVVELPAVSSQDLNVEPGTSESGGEFSADSLVQHLQEDNKENVEKVSIRCAAVDTSCDDTKTEQDLKLDESGDQIEISASGSEAVAANATEDLKASQAEELMEVTEIAEEAPAMDEIDFDEFDVVDEIDDDDEEAEMGDSEEQGERSAQGEFLAKKRPLLMPTEKNFENSRPMGSTSPTLAFYELDKVGENEARTVKSPKMAKIQEPVTRRSEPLPEVALFVDSLTKVSFDWKKFTCFYCNPCHLYLTSTALWEDHMMEPSHKKNMVRWKMAVALQNEICSTSKLQQKIGACREFLMGADKVIEVAPDGNTTSFVCVLCNFVCTNFDYLVLHLTGFGHIDTFMESVCSHLFRPPTLSSLPKNHKTNSRVVDEKWKSTILSEARKYVNRHGVGHLRTFSGDQYADWVDVDEDQQDMEEAILQEQVNDFLTDEHHSDVRAGVLAHNWSSANEEYEKMSTTQKDKYIGLQYLIELWAPSRSVIAVWYCTLCDSIAIDWTKHCESVQHIAAYLKKDYKTHAYDCAVLEANSEEELRSNFALAKSKVLQFEGYQARVKFVLQVQKLQEIDSFVAINAKIAKILVARQNFVIEPLARKPRKGDMKNIAEALKGAAKSTSPKSDRHRKERDTKKSSVEEDTKWSRRKETSRKSRSGSRSSSSSKRRRSRSRSKSPDRTKRSRKSPDASKRVFLSKSAIRDKPENLATTNEKSSKRQLEKKSIGISGDGERVSRDDGENNSKTEQTVKESIVEEEKHDSTLPLVTDDVQNKRFALDDTTDAASRESKSSTEAQAQSKTERLTVDEEFITKEQPNELVTSSETTGTEAVPTGQHANQNEPSESSNSCSNESASLPGSSTSDNVFKVPAVLPKRLAIDSSLNDTKSASNSEMTTAKSGDKLSPEEQLEDDSIANKGGCPKILATKKPGTVKKIAKEVPKRDQVAKKENLAKSASKTTDTPESRNKKNRSNKSDYAESRKRKRSSRRRRSSSRSSSSSTSSSPRRRRKSRSRSGGRRGSRGSKRDDARKKWPEMGGREPESGKFGKYPSKSVNKASESVGDQSALRKATAAPAHYVLLTEQNLVEFTGVLRSVGVDLGRRVVVGDLPTLRSQFADPESFDFLLQTVLESESENAKKLDYIGPTNKTNTDEVISDLTTAASFDKSTPAPSFDHKNQFTDDIVAPKPIYGKKIWCSVTKRWVDSEPAFQTPIVVDNTRDQMTIPISAETVSSMEQNQKSLSTRKNTVSAAVQQAPDIHKKNTAPVVVPKRTSPRFSPKAKSPPAVIPFSLGSFLAQNLSSDKKQSPPCRNENEVKEETYRSKTEETAKTAPRRNDKKETAPSDAPSSPAVIPFSIGSFLAGLKSDSPPPIQKEPIDARKKRKSIDHSANASDSWNFAPMGSRRDANHYGGDSSSAADRAVKHSGPIFESPNFQSNAAPRVEWEPLPQRSAFNPNSQKSVPKPYGRKPYSDKYDNTNKYGDLDKYGNLDKYDNLNEYGTLNKYGNLDRYENSKEYDNASEYGNESDQSFAKPFKQRKFDTSSYRWAAQDAKSYHDDRGEREISNIGLQERSNAYSDMTSSFIVSAESENNSFQLAQQQQQQPSLSDLALDYSDLPPAENAPLASTSTQGSTTRLQQQRTLTPSQSLRAAFASYFSHQPAKWSGGVPRWP